VPQIHWVQVTGRVGAGPLTEDMVSETSLPERRAGLRPISRPSRLAFGVAMLAVVSGCFTYALLTDLLPYHLGRAGQIALLVFNLALVLSLATAIGWRIARLMATRRSGRAGAKLHVRLVTWFSAIAVIPVILVAIFAAVTLNLGLDQMFSGRVKEALTNAVNVAQVYAREQQRSILDDAYKIATDIQSDPRLFDQNKHVSASFLL
jgi:two-component system nitrogen regulation sensor histidine kinase NtrY